MSEHLSQPAQRPRLSSRCKAFTSLDVKERLLDTLSSDLVHFECCGDAPFDAAGTSLFRRQTARFFTTQGGEDHTLLIVSNDPHARRDGIPFAFTGASVCSGADFCVESLDLAHVNKEELLSGLLRSFTQETAALAERIRRATELKRRRRESIAADRLASVERARSDQPA